MVGGGDGDFFYTFFLSWTSFFAGVTAAYFFTDDYLTLVYFVYFVGGAGLTDFAL